MYTIIYNTNIFNIKKNLGPTPGSFYWRKRCSYCTKKFKYESERKRHEQSHVPQFECEKCFKKFSFLSALKRHQKQHERTGSAQCNECGRHFRDETLLKRHIKYAHKGTYICSKCDAKFNSDLALKSHMKIHKPKNERRFQCSAEGCDKSFNFAHHLKHHLLAHTNSKQHYCNVCGKGFIQSHHLKSHLRTHEPNHWLPCTESDCNKKFVSEDARQRHIVTHSYKNTIDSGISSDSNCDVSQHSVTDATLCATCGQIISKALYQEHETKCLPKEEPEDITSNVKNELENNNYIDMFSNCKTVLGKCIATEASSCLCAQIKDANNFYDSMLPNCNFEPVKLKMEIKLHDNVIDQPHYVVNATDDDFRIVKPQEDGKFDDDVIDQPHYVTNATDDDNIGVVKLQEDIEVHNNLVDQPSCIACCDCDCSQNNSTNDIAIECTNDGAIKIKDTFDFDYNLKNDLTYRCKTLFGRCIVSGSGTISEGCLCAKMAMDEQINQEIDEITPKPATYTSI